MSLPDQNVQPDRYSIIPRTLTFILQGSRVLLLKLSPNKGAWSGRYNGIGGHIEMGEIPHASARREIREETGLDVTALELVGVIMVDTGGRPGIGLYVFIAEIAEDEPLGGDEGAPVWVEIDQLSQVPLVDDLPIILPRALQSHRDGTAFSCLTTFDAKGNPSLAFLP
jgi:8-oxo-dGTP diphosphatase